MNETPAARVFFFELLDGDLRKLEAESNNDPAQGGGARDFRFPDAPFRSFMEKLFPAKNERLSKTDGQEVQYIHSGHIHWYENGELKSTEVQYYPPTKARPSEGRITKIHELPPLHAMMPQAPAGRLFLVLVQSTDGRVFPDYIDEEAVRDGAPYSRVPEAVLSCIERVDATAGSKGRAADRVMGYVDFAPSGSRATESYCHER